MKSYTDLEQSKKLAGILPLESADMSYSFNFDSEIYEISTTSYRSWVVPKYAQPDNGFGQIIPCWSLAALLDYLKNKNKFPEIAELSDGRFKLTTFIWSGKDCMQISIENTLVDACYELILKLHEQKLL